MSKTFLVVILAFFISVSCQKELDFENLDDQVTLLNKGDENLKIKSGKMDICHYSSDDKTWHIININSNAWPSHKAHGDVRVDDQDKDGYVLDNECGYGQMGDCDDNNDQSYPGAFPLQQWYLVADADNDGWHVILNIFTGTCYPTGYINEEEAYRFFYDDCDDSNPAVNPGATEICNSIDNNCNGYLFDITANAKINNNTVLATGAFFGLHDTTISGTTQDANGPLACNPIANLAGKIALIDRGSCFFQVKTLNAQAAGAIGVIICNHNGLELPLMGGVSTLTDPNIPTIMLSYQDCQLLRLNPGSVVEFSVDTYCQAPGLRNANVQNSNKPSFAPGLPKKGESLNILQ